METQRDTYPLPLLTPFLRDEIIFAMEDQERTYFLDLETGMLVQEEEIEGDLSVFSEDRYLSIPDWEPADGFRIMEKFSNLVRNPLYREKLLNALQVGKGVFRRFKDIVSEQPALERQWFAFKDLEMERAVFTWYKSNNGAIQLKELNPEPEELTDDILQEDFLIESTVDEVRLQEITELQQILLDELDRGNAAQKKSLLFLLLKLQESRNLEYIYALTQGGYLAGYIAYRILESQTAEIVFFGIRQEFRGLGLFKHLFDSFSRKVSRRGIPYLVINLGGETVGLDKLFVPMEGTIITKQVLITSENWNSSQTSTDIAFL
ncbi:UPF0158 family protein [uncultured Sphaerochaeta sp.]|uniref:GNAT family N-acetyltransferase n=1 Tax=uncultured Sphaerochaeta sp. TaxID=886478 RepID=UPI002A0A7193|nr:UPF0158 family protein [uncultured Sphaerochaeta sp.]